MTEPPVSDEELDALTLQEVAAHLRCSEMHVRRLISSGELKHIDTASRGSKRTKLRVPREALAAYLRAKTRRGVA